jgi:hypothetical protein
MTICKQHKHSNQSNSSTDMCGYNAHKDFSKIPHAILQCANTFKWFHLPLAAAIPAQTENEPIKLTK